MFRENTNHLQESIFDTLEIMDKRVKAKFQKSWAPIFYENVFTKIDEKPFGILYGETGNSNFPVNILLSLEYIKHMKNLTDLEMLDSYYFDYLVNYALGNRSVGQRNLAERTIYNFRERIYKYFYENPEKEDILFGSFISLVENFSKKVSISTTHQRMDTTMFMSNIKKAGRLALAYDVLINTIRAIPEESRTDAIKDAVSAGFKTEILYRSKVDEKESRLEQLVNLTNEASNILGGIPGGLETKAYRIAARFLREQAVPEPSTGRLRTIEGSKVSTSSLQSVYDEDATYRKKGSHGQSGYVLCVTETCGDDNPFQLITDYHVDRNITSDVDILDERLPEISDNTDCTDLYVDGSFNSPKVLDTAEEEKVNLHFTNLNGRDVSKKLPVTDFVVDEATDIIKQCPKGFKPLHTGISGGQTVAHFPHSACGSCEFKDVCHIRRQKKDYVARILLKAVRTARERLAMNVAKAENTSRRAGIEGTYSAMKRSQGLDKLLVRRIIRCTMDCCYKVTSQNIRRFVKYLQGGYDRAKPKRALYRITAPVTV